jgi:hypothetical protein
MTRAGRIVLVTAGLSLAGAVFGAIASITALSALVLGSAIVDRTGYSLGGEVLLVAGTVGAMCGVVLGPLTAWVALRRVPLGRALLSTTAGTVIGAMLGTPFAFGSILGALGGFVLAVIWLRRGTGTGSAQLKESSGVT